MSILSFFFFQAEDGIRDGHVTGVQTCALPISAFVSAIVHQPYGAFPTSVYKLYDYHEPEIVDYQRRSRHLDGLDDYLDDCVRNVKSFDEYLDLRDPDREIRRSLETAMRSLL